MSHNNDMDNSTKTSVKTLSGNSYITLLTCLSVTLALGISIGHISGYYKGFSLFVTPPFTPPDILVAVINPVMFALLSLSLHAVITDERDTSALLGNHKKISVMLWLALLITSISWMPMFFIGRMLMLSFIWLAIALSISITLIIINTKINKLSWILLIPCSIWLSMLTYLSFGIALLN